MPGQFSVTINTTWENILKLAQAMRDALANTPVGERRGHIRAVIDEIRVGSDSLQIIGQRSRLSRLVALGEPVPSPVPTFVRKWRSGWDSNPRYTFAYGGFQDHCLRPLGHRSYKFCTSGNFQCCQVINATN